MKEDAPLWRTLTPINRIKDALSCSKTYFTVVPVNINALQWQIHHSQDPLLLTEEKRIYHSVRQYDLRPMSLIQQKKQPQAIVLLVYQVMLVPEKLAVWRSIKALFKKLLHSSIQQKSIFYTRKGIDWKNREWTTISQIKVENDMHFTVHIRIYTKNCYL